MKPVWRPFNNWKKAIVKLEYKNTNLTFNVFEEDSDTGYREETLSSQIAIECYDSDFDGLFRHKKKYKDKHYGFMTFISNGKLDTNSSTVLVEGLGYDETECINSSEIKLIKQVLEKAGALKFSKELAKRRFI